MKKISVVIPAHNEEGNILPMAEALAEVFQSLPYEYELIFIDDGSTDRTLEVLQAVAQERKHVFYIEFSRNFGHQPALKAGIDYADGDCVISLDCDMQHPPTLIPELIRKWEEGYDIVYTRRKEDKKLPYMKRKTSHWFYLFTNKISGVEMEEGTADFRLIDRRVADVFSTFLENDLFIRGMIKWMGFRQYAIDYTPGERLSGETKYTFQKMLSFAVKGITSFSVSPLYLAMYIGMFMAVAAILYLPYVLYAYFTGHSAAGWASVLLSVVFFGGLQLIMLGILGIYVGKLFMQSKNRPTYIVRRTNKGRIV